MINETQQQQMLEYIADKLSKSYKKIEDRKKSIVDKKKSNYLVLDDDKVVFIIDRIYHPTNLDMWYTKTQYSDKISDVAFIIYKDGDQFFKSNAQNYYSTIHGKEFKRYSNQEINKMISFSPEEKILYDIFGVLNYYQPQTKRLNKSLRKFHFNKVIHDIINKEILFSGNKSNDYIWTETEVLDKDIRISSGKILPT
jgi:PhoPQ-activated pathogenicity-related protein